MTQAISSTAATSDARIDQRTPERLLQARGAGRRRQQRQALLEARVDAGLRRVGREVLQVVAHAPCVIGLQDLAPPPRADTPGRGRIHSRNQPQPGLSSGLDVHHRRHEQIRGSARLGADEARRRDADHLVRDLSDADGACPARAGRRRSGGASSRGRCTATGCPPGVRSSAGPKQASQGRLQAEDAEDVARVELPVDALRLVGAGNDRLDRVARADHQQVGAITDQRRRSGGRSGSRSCRSSRRAPGRRRSW